MRAAVDSSGEQGFGVEVEGLQPGTLTLAELRLDVVRERGQPQYEHLGYAEDHLIARHKGLRADYATERMTARRVSDVEAEALKVPAERSRDERRITVHQASGDPIMTSVLVMPGSRHEIEDTYALS